MYTCFVINCSDQSDCSEFQNNEIGSVRLSAGLCRNQSSVDFAIFSVDFTGIRPWNVWVDGIIRS